MSNLLIKWFVKDCENVKDETVRQRYGVVAGAVGIFCNLLLASIKVVLGILTGAISIAGDAVNNLSDSLSSIVTLVGFKVSGKPADREHPYGHGRAEYIAAFIVAAAVVAIALELLKSSVSSIMHKGEIDVRPVTIVILICTILVKFWMAHFYTMVGNRIHSEVTKAAAMDSRSDCIITGVALISVTLVLLFDINIDGYAGALVALFVIWSGLKSAKETIEPLLGSAPDPELVQEIEDTAKAHPEILGVHDLRVHEYGPSRRIASLHAEISCEVGMIRAHEIVDAIEREIVEKHLVNEITIHTDPVDLKDRDRMKLENKAIEVLRNLGVKEVHDFRLLKTRDGERLVFDAVVGYETNITEDMIKGALLDELSTEHPDLTITLQLDKA